MKKIIPLVVGLLFLFTPLLAEKIHEDNIVKFIEPPQLESPQDFSLQLKGGTYSAGNFQGYSGEEYWEVARGEQGMGAGLAFEWQFFQALGKLGAKLTSGLYGNHHLDPKRYAFALVGGAIYRLDLVHNQLMVPFVEVGSGYLFHFTGGSKNRVKYKREQYHSYLSLGTQILLDFFDQNSAGTFDVNWGINSTFLTIEYQKIFDSDFYSAYDLSSGSFVFIGLLFEF